jgi:D-amino peptidase
MRLYISADIEGIPGVVSEEHLRPGGYEYEAARGWMTSFVIAAAEAAKGAGATEIVVSDSHGNGLNIRPDKMPDYVRLVRSWPRPLGMMQGIEIGRYDGAMLLGYHGGSDSSEGVMTHTLSSNLYHSVRIDGLPVSEADISALIASYFQVPVILVAGDDVTIREVGGWPQPCIGVVTKRAVSGHSAIGASPQSVEEELRRGVETAVARAGEAARPTPPKGPHVAELRLRTRGTARATPTLFKF